MNIKFLALTLATIGLQTQAKSFRGDDVFLKSFVQKIKALKSIDADDIAGETNFSVPEYQGDIKHHAALNGEVKKTAEIIEQQLAIGMRTNFIYVKEAITQYADDDGIVRDGVVFCNAKNDTTGDAIVYQSFNASSKNYYEFTENLVSSDGFGVRDNKTDNGKSRDVLQCGRSNCEEGSFVTLVANRIRSLGYHVTHSDICDAKTGGVGYTGVPTCALASNNESTYKFQAYKCEAASVALGNDFYQVKKDCFMITNKTKCNGTDAPKCTAMEENGVYACLPSGMQNATAGKNCSVNTVDDLTIEQSSGANVINGVRRVIQYGTQKTKVKTTDVAYVTGSPKAVGCTSLREYVNALNGMAQIAAFRDTNILEAESHWNDIIEHTRSYLKSYAEILNDFYDKSTQIFPVIEFDQLDECPVGNVERESNDLGSEEKPLCDQDDTDSKDTQRALDLESQILIRKRCFCRQGSLGNTDNYNSTSKQPKTSAFELDELYLMTEPPDSKDCDALQAMDAPSYYQYCKGNAFDDRTWKKTLQDLLPMKHAIKTFGYNHSTKQTNIYNKLGATLPQHWNSTASTPKAKVASKPNCGRLVTTSSSSNSSMSSNKGGNCVPFRGLHEILFRLEFETSQDYMGTQQDCTGNFSAEKDCRFEQVACRNSDALENTLFGFRQFGYVWDHPMYKNSDSATRKTSPVQSDTLSVWTNGYNDTDTIANGKTQTQNSWSVGSDKLFRLADNKQQCNINWGLQITGDVARKDAYGSSYEDPYDLFEREIQEAIVNVEVAMAAKTKAVENTEKLWSKISDELTDFDASGNTIASDLSYEVAEHFMRITTTDSDDPNVDSLDDGAVHNNATEVPEPMTGMTGARI